MGGTVGTTSLAALGMRLICLRWIYRVDVESRASMLDHFSASILREKLQAFLAHVGNDFASNLQKTHRNIQKNKKTQALGQLNLSF